MAVALHQHLLICIRKNPEMSFALDTFQTHNNSEVAFSQLVIRNDGTRLNVLTSQNAPLPVDYSNYEENVV